MEKETTTPLGVGLDVGLWCRLSKSIASYYLSLKRVIVLRIVSISRRLYYYFWTFIDGSQVAYTP